MGFIGEMGAMSLELRYLAALFPSAKQEDRHFWLSVVEHLRAQLRKASPSALYGLTMEPTSKQFRVASLANDAQHFFGYLVRSYLQTAGGDAEALPLFTAAVAGAVQHRLIVEHNVTGSGSELEYPVTVEDVDYVAREGDGVMKVGACQLASTLALAGMRKLAEALAETCWLQHSYTPSSGNSSGGNSSNGSSNSSNGNGNTSSGNSSLRLHRLPAAEVKLNRSREAGRKLEQRGVLSAELAESYFTLWRLTKKEVWRSRAWALVQAINGTARVGGGFSELAYGLNAAGAKEEKMLHTDYQPPEFLGATLKYLYLTFADFAQLPLEKWVFNAAGQPLPVCGTSTSAYPKCDG